MLFTEMGAQPLFSAPFKKNFRKQKKSIDNRTPVWYY